MRDTIKYVLVLIWFTITRLGLSIWCAIDGKWFVSFTCLLLLVGEVFFFLRRIINDDPLYQKYKRESCKVSC
jgi:hypothetical protein